MPNIKNRRDKGGLLGILGKMCSLSIQRPAWLSDNLHSYKNKYIGGKAIRDYKWGKYGSTKF